MLLGVSEELIRELAAQALVAVCTRRPLPDGYWGAVSAGSVTAIPQRQPFSGRHLARLVQADALACITVGSAEMRRAMIEPPSGIIEASPATYSLLGTAESTVIHADDLLISRAEFARVISQMGSELKKFRTTEASDSTLGALTRSRMKSLSLRARDGAAEREAEYQRWRDCASTIQAERLYPASKRQLAVLVKASLGLPDSEETIRRRL